MPYIKSDNPSRRRAALKVRDGFKGCCRCGKELPATEVYFQRNEHSDDGFQGYCRVCMGSRLRIPKTVIEVPKRRHKDAARVNDAIRKCLTGEIAELNGLVFEEDRVKLEEDVLCFRVVWEVQEERFKRRPGGQQEYYIEDEEEEIEA